MPFSYRPLGRATLTAPLVSFQVERSPTRSSSILDLPPLCPSHQRTETVSGTEVWRGSILRDCILYLCDGFSSARRSYRQRGDDIGERGSIGYIERLMFVTESLSGWHVARYWWDDRDGWMRFFFFLRERYKLGRWRIAFYSQLFWRINNLGTIRNNNPINHLIILLNIQSWKIWSFFSLTFDYFLSWLHCSSSLWIFILKYLKISTNYFECTAQIYFISLLSMSSFQSG